MYYVYKVDYEVRQDEDRNLINGEGRRLLVQTPLFDRRCIQNYSYFREIMIIIRGLPDTS